MIFTGNQIQRPPGNFHIYHFIRQTCLFAVDFASVWFQVFSSMTRTKDPDSKFSTT